MAVGNFLWPQAISYVSRTREKAWGHASCTAFERSTESMVRHHESAAMDGELHLFCGHAGDWNAQRSR